MTVTSRIFNTISNSQVQFAGMFDSFLTSGYVPGYLGELEPSINPDLSMTVNIATGRARIKGYWYDGLTVANLALSTGSAQARIDRIILQLETGSPRQISLKVLEGTPGTPPSAPTLTKNSSVWEISLVQIPVAANATSITTFTDERDDLSVCGAASSRKAKFSEIIISDKLPLGTQKVVNLPAPVNSTDAARKKYFDDTTGGTFGSNICEITPFAGSSVPSEWLECDGSSLACASYPDLFAAFGYSFGGSGANFNLPNLKGKFIYGNSTTPGSTGGAKTHQLTVPEMPAHTHTPSIQDWEYLVTWGGASSLYNAGSPASVAPGSAGGDGAHNNLHPYITMKYIVRGS